MTKLARPHLNDPRYSASVIPPYVLTFLIDLAGQRGWDPAPWFAGLGIAPQQCYEPDARVSFRQASTVIRRALAATGEPSLGLQVGLRETLSSCGVLGLALMSAPTLGEVLAVAARYHGVTGSFMDLRVEPGASQVALVASERFAEPDLLPFFCEELFLCCQQVAKALIGTGYQPLCMEFTYPRPAYAALYEAAFDCPVRFGAKANRAVFDAAALHARPATANAAVHASALNLCSQQSGQAGAVDHVTALEFWLRERLGSGVRIGDAARALNVSERTLRRRLADAGWNFRALHNHLRAEHAEALLRSSARPVAGIGAELGFSDGREFRRAFKRWTGRAPNAARRASR
ncbi:AraC family transcriptional regulator [Solimonas flava]|uniref:AraC family transcriptional regulator n=1 Tax=Solimonas flava TaxID=415849 RepID=UPI0003F79F4F|nr:AraC family transcriptional regulator [Solimonas flava]